MLLAIGLLQPNVYGRLRCSIQNKPNFTSTMNVTSRLAFVVTNDDILPQPNSLAGTNAAPVFRDGIISD